MKFKALFLIFSASLAVSLQASFFDIKNFTFINLVDLYQYHTYVVRYQKYLEHEIANEIPGYSKEKRAERRAELVKKAEGLREELCSVGEELMLKGLLYGSIATSVASVVVGSVYAHYANKDSCASYALTKASQECPINKQLIAELDSNYWRNQTISAGSFVAYFGSILTNSWAAKKLMPFYGKRDHLRMVEKAIAKIDELTIEANSVV